MLRSLKELEGYTVGAADGDIGNVGNFLLDDERWGVRYLVVESDEFLKGRRVLISPISFMSADWSTRRFNLALTMKKVQNSPDIDLRKPVSRRHEFEYNLYYGHPHYWGSMEVWGMFNCPNAVASDSGIVELSEHSDKVSVDGSVDVHLRSAGEVRGYHIHGSDEAIGHVADFIVDDETWEVRYLVIDTSNWWFGKKVLVSPHWASRISWAEKMVYLDMSRQKIQECPEWDATAVVNREYERRLYNYYGRPTYWVGGDHPEDLPSATTRPPG